MDAACRMLRIGCRDRELLEPGEQVKLIEAAAILDLYGQRVKAKREGGSRRPPLRPG